jgi:chloramphenicol-sensitive protein RarD
VAVFMACAAVGNLAIRGAGFPWIALVLATSFSLYGLVRKKVDIASLHGLLVETLLLLPLAIVVLCRPAAREVSPANIGLLAWSGIITAVPLLLFGVAVRGLKLLTIGFLQYIGPTFQFLVALVIFREPLDNSKLFSFVFCWIAVALYVADSILSRQPPALTEEPD